MQIQSYMYARLKFASLIGNNLLLQKLKLKNCQPLVKLLMYKSSKRQSINFFKFKEKASFCMKYKK